MKIDVTPRQVHITWWDGLLLHIILLDDSEHNVGPRHVTVGKLVGHSNPHPVAVTAYVGHNDPSKVRVLFM